MKVFGLKTGYGNEGALVVIKDIKGQTEYKGATFLNMVYITTPEHCMERELVEVILHELNHARQYQQAKLKHFITRSHVPTRVLEEAEAYIFSVRDAVIFDKNTRDTLEEVYEAYHWDISNKPYRHDEYYNYHTYSDNVHESLFTKNITKQLNFKNIYNNSLGGIEKTIEDILYELRNEKPIKPKILRAEFLAIHKKAYELI